MLGLGVGGALLVTLVIAFRPVARSGAIAYAQLNLRTVADVAERVGLDDGSLSTATRERLADEAALGDILLIDPDQGSNDPEVVSVLATDEAWTGTTRAETGECFWIRIQAQGETVRGTGTDCSAEDASAAEPGDWPDP
jgi:hypothetical protein